jgi:vanillate/3-O-methylgallate O-demethylase
MHEALMPDQESELTPVTAENLDQKIRRIGDPVTMLRNSPQGHYEFPIPSEYSNWGDEQAAWQHTAVLFDQSFHMTDVYFRGSHLKDFFASIAVNSFATFGPDKAKQLVTVNPDGYVIGDGILFGLGKEEFSLVGRPAAPDYAAYMAEARDFDIEVTQDLRSTGRDGKRLTFRYQLRVRTRPPCWRRRAARPCLKSSSSTSGTSTWAAPGYGR